jgi:aspartate/methionine/tyrosine aminotransferase
MDLPPFLLDHWLAAYDFREPPIPFNLASSTGPRWSVGELTALGAKGPDIAGTVLSYAPPDGGGDLRQAIADFQLVPPETVVMTTGSSEALSILLCLHARPGGALVLPDPGYPAYVAMAGVWGLKVQPYRLEAAAAFQQNADVVLAAVTEDTVAVVVNTPHNPSGSVMDRNEIKRLASALATRSIPLIVDEVYHPLYFGDPQPSAAGVDNVIVTSDLSKAFSLPGLRTGWIIDAHASRRARIIDARSYFTISSSPLLETLAAHAIRQRHEILAKLERTAIANLDCLGTLMAEVGDTLSWVRPHGGTTSFPWFTDGRNSRKDCEALADKGVLVAPGDCFGHPAHLRIGFAQEASGFASAIEIIHEHLAANG